LATSWSWSEATSDEEKRPAFGSFISYGPSQGSAKSPFDSAFDWQQKLPLTIPHGIIFREDSLRDYLKSSD
jgi:hypothetical protein